MHFQTEKILAEKTLDNPGYYVPIPENILA